MKLPIEVYIAETSVSRLSSSERKSFCILNSCHIHSTCYIQNCTSGAHLELASLEMCSFYEGGH